MRGEGEEGWLVHDSGAQAARLREAPARRRHHHQAAGKSLGQHSLWPVEYEDGRDGEVELPQPAGIPDRWRGDDSGAGAARIDRPYRLCDFERRIALYAQRRADAAEARVDHDGRDRWSSAGALRTQRRKVRRGFGRAENAGAEKGDGRTEIAARFDRPRND